MRERLSEVFAVFMTQVFLFGHEVPTFRRHSMIRYSKSVASAGANEREVLIQFSELLIRLFLATDVVETMTDEPIRWPHKYPARQNDSLSAALDRFRRMIDDLGPYFSDYEHLFQGLDRNRATEFCRAQFGHIYSRASPFLPGLWEEGMAIYWEFIHDATGTDRSSVDPVEQFYQIRANIDAAVNQSMEEGSVVVRSTCDGDCRSGVDDALDPMLLICSMLRRYIGAVRTAEGKDIHLYRDPHTGNVDFGHKHNWHEFLIDRGAASMFCPVPTARRWRLRRQISIAKTLWDISSALRARRLAQIMKDNWPEPPS